MAKGKGKGKKDKESKGGAFGNKKKPGDDAPQASTSDQSMDQPPVAEPQAGASTQTQVPYRPASDQQATSSGHGGPNSNLGQGEHVSSGIQGLPSTLSQTGSGARLSELFNAPPAEFDQVKPWEDYRSQKRSATVPKVYLPNGRVPGINRDIIANEDRIIRLPRPNTNVTSEYPIYDAPRPVREPNKTGHKGKAKDVTPARGPTVSLALNRHLNYPVRPGYATGIDSKTTLLTNSFHVDFDPTIVLHRYAIGVRFASMERRSDNTDETSTAPANPDLEPVGKKRRRIIELFLSGPTLEDMRSSIASDYQSMLISTEEIPQDRWSAKVDYRGDYEEVVAPWYGVYDVALSKIEGSSLSMGDLQSYLQTADSRNGSAAFDAFKQALNIILACYPKLRPNRYTLSQGNRHFLSSEPAIDLHLGIKAVRGFMSSARFSAGTLLAQVQVKTIAMYKTANLNTVIWDFHKDFKDIQGLDKLLNGMRVKVLYLPLGTNDVDGKPMFKTRALLGLAMVADRRKSTLHADKKVQVNQDGEFTAQVMFWNDQLKKRESVMTYFRREWGAKGHNLLNDNESAAVKYGTPENPKYMPAELCEVVEAQPITKQLSPLQMDNMLNDAARPPYDNARLIQESGPRVFNWKNPIMSNFGLKVQANLMTIPGRVLDPPEVLYLDDNKTGPKHAQVRNALWNLVGLKFNKAPMEDFPTANGWNGIALYASRGRKFTRNVEIEKTCDEALEAFKEQAKKCGMSMGAPGKTESLWSESPALADDLTTKLEHHKRKGVKLVIVFLPGGKDPQLYKTIKQVGDVRVGIHTVVVRTSGKNNFTKGEAGFLSNVALKVNLKFGGGNQGLQPGRLPIINKGTTMLMGLDVTHPAPGSSKAAPSVAAMVASIDSDCQQFPAVIRLNPAHTEMVQTDKLKAMTEACLTRWTDKSSKPPEQIIVYRDGVSEGQYNTIVQFEYTAIRDAAQAFCEGKDKPVPKITVVVCGKRHHTRFYPTSKSAMDFKTANTLPGTLVDRIVCDPRDWDFYLQPHKALQGTVKPCHYIVVHDEIFSTNGTRDAAVAKQLIDLTHNLCYMYQKATLPVSVCPPAYYADKAADRARVLLSRWFNEDVSSTGGNADDESTDGMPTQAQEDALKVHKHLVDSMFYI